MLKNMLVVLSLLMMFSISSMHRFVPSLKHLSRSAQELKTISRAYASTAQRDSLLDKYQQKEEMLRIDKQRFQALHEIYQNRIKKGAQLTFLSTLTSCSGVLAEMQPLLSLGVYGLMGTAVYTAFALHGNARVKNELKANEAQIAYCNKHVQELEKIEKEK